MNLIAACVCLPVFVIIFLVDCFFFAFSRKPLIPTWQKAICAGCLVSSFFEWTSLIFWIAGFSYEATGLVSGACEYIVAAEILIILYQWVFSVTTFYLLLVMTNVYLNLRTMVISAFPKFLWTIFGVFVFISFFWIFIQVFSPYNKWCVAEEKILLPLFQPTTMVWCTLDVITSLSIVAVFFLITRKLDKHSSNMSDLGMSNNSTTQNSAIQNYKDESSRGKNKDKSGESMKQHQLAMEKHVKFALQQAFVSIISSTVAGIIFDQQFNKGNVNGDLVCVFCVMLYLGYAVRRVPMLWHFSGFRAQQAEDKKLDHQSLVIESTHSPKSKPSGSKSEASGVEISSFHGVVARDTITEQHTELETP